LTRTLTFENFRQDLPNALLHNDAAVIRSAGTRYNTTLINALVLYVAASVVSSNGVHGLQMGPNGNYILKSQCPSIFIK
jgi:hypothetical protein